MPKSVCGFSVDPELRLATHVQGDFEKLTEIYYCCEAGREMEVLKIPQSYENVDCGLIRMKILH